MQNNQQGSLQNKFEGFSAAPSDLLWNSIAANLDQDEKKKGIIWWWFLGAAASITLLIGVYQMGYNKGTQENTIALKEKTTTPIDSPKDNQTTILNNDTNPTASNKNELTNPIDNQNSTIGLNKKTIKNNLNDKNKNQVSLNNSNQKNQQSNRNENKIDSKVINKINELDNNTIAALPIENEKISDINRLPLTSTERITRNLFSPTNLDEYFVKIEKPEEKNNWEIGFNIGTNYSRKPTEENYFVPPSNSLTTADIQTENYVQGTNYAAMSAPIPINLLITRPINLEFTLGKKLGKRWRFQTGLNASFFRGKNNYSSPDLNKTTANYIGLGIPLHFNCDIIQGKRLSWYTGIGINSDIPIFETIKYTSNTEEVNKHKELTLGYMGSTQINTGIRCAINEKIDLNVNPYFKYYFAQSVNSSVPLLKRNTWFGAAVGLVWKL